MGNKDFLTKYGTDSIVGIKWDTITDVAKFEEALDELEKTVYYSNTAEKRRMWHKRFKINLFKDEEGMKEVFKTTVLSLFYQIDKTKTYDDLLRGGYVINENTNNLHYFEISEKEFYIKIIYIHKDTIYKDLIQSFETKKGYKMKFYKEIKVPFVREYLSQNTHISNFALNKQWNQWRKSMEKGVRSC